MAELNYFRPPPEMSFSGNVSENWRKWQQKFVIFLEVTGKAKKKVPESEKIAMLLNFIGDEGLEIYNTFEVSKCHDETRTLENVLKAFTEYCSPMKNVIFDRFNFFKCIQEEGEPFDQFLTRLKILAGPCEFGNEEENLIRDRVVLGIQDLSVQERLLRQPKLTLRMASNYCRAAEVAGNQLKVVHGGTTVDLVKAKGTDKCSYDKSSLNYSSVKGNKCSYCGLVHFKNAKCTAFGKICAKCKKLNHFARVCKAKDVSRSVRELNKDTFEEELDDIEKGSLDFQVLSIDGRFINSKKDETSWSKNVLVEPNNLINFKLDSGAEVSVLPNEIFRDLGCSKKLSPTNVSLVAFGNQTMKPIGKVNLKCATKSKFINVEFMVVNIPFCKPILGLKACVDLELIKRVDQIQKTTYNTKESVIELNSDVFNGTGKIIGNPYHITLQENYTPIIMPTRRIPKSLHGKLKLTLSEMEMKGIISKVDYPTDWVNALVLVEKPNGSLRICLDPKHLNKSIKRAHFPIPTTDELLSDLGSKSVFSVLDLKDGFWNVELDEESSNLCVFGTPFGRYKFNRLPFGISIAPEVFQKKNVEMFGCIPNVNVYFDDIIISGRTKAEHDVTLKLVLAKAREYGVKFNPDKFQFSVAEVKFVGFLISSEGIKPDQKYLEAILKMPNPSNKKELLRLLGMAKYLSRFIPNLSALCAPLRELTKNDVDWIWSSVHEDCVNKLKNTISNTPVLSHYDSSKALTIQTDASQTGLGACLLQDGHPVGFASRSLTNCEQRYAQIEKELLAIVFAAEKFHQHIYGRVVTVQSDHKPLESIFKKDIGKVSARLQRMLLRLLKYQLNVVYIPGKEMYIADTLSRAYLNYPVDDDPEMQYLVHCLTKRLPLSDVRLEQFKNETCNDDELSSLYKQCESGWPENKSDLPDNIKMYWSMKDSIREFEGLVFFEDRVIVPKSLRRELLDIIHEGHFGISKCKERARQGLFWPRMGFDIEQHVSKCLVCKKFSSAQKKEPMIPHPVPRRAWDCLGLDILELYSKNYLVAIDYMSKWIELVDISNKSASSVILRLKAIFSRMGIPSKVVCDNIPFNSREFKLFSKEWDFVTVTSSPRYPQSNGLVEKAVGICKQMLRKSVASKQDIYSALLVYRNTPISGIGLSPAQMMMNRRLRDKLPMVESLLKPECVSDIVPRLMQRQHTQKKYYDRGSKHLPLLQKNERVFYRKRNTWEPCTVVSTHETPRSYIIKNQSGRIIRRNRRHLLSGEMNSIASQTQLTN